MATIASQINRLYEFGPFRLNPQKRLLTHGTEVVSLTPKAVETLTVLVENRGRVVSKDDLMKALWPDSFVEESNLSQNIFLLRKALGDSKEKRYIVTVPGRGYQFAGTVQEIEEQEESTLVVQSRSRSEIVVQSAVARSTWLRVAAVAMVIVLIGIAGVRWFFHRMLPPDGRAPLFVAEFTNATGDAAFDEVLREIVKTELDRSPVVEVMDEEHVAELLQTMGKSYGTRLTPELTQQLCERDKGKLLAAGEIKPQGAGYVVELSILDCTSRNTLSHRQAEAKNKDEVMTMVSQVAAATRLQLSGNSGNLPITPAPLPTKSLTAFKDYLLGARIVHSQPQQSANLLRRATELDPNFAEAWGWLAIADNGLGESQRESEDLTREFALRESLPDGERAFAEARYYLTVTGEIYKGIDALRSWEKLEPKEFPPHNLLGLSYSDLGLYQKATDEYREAATLFPSDELGYENLAGAFLSQGRYDEAENTLRRIPKEEPDTASQHWLKYALALLRSDQAAIEQERRWMVQNADDLEVVATQERIDLVDGHLDLAQQHTQHAVSIALESNLKESAANALLVMAEAQALLGESAVAHKNCSQAMEFENSKSVKVAVSRVMALNGQGQEAQQIMNRLTHENPSDTLLNGVDVPVILAASQLRKGQADQALRTLEAVKPYEFGNHARLLPNYLRAMAFLQLEKPNEAAAEFNAVWAHRSVSPMDPLWNLSRLGLARTYKMQGDKVKASAAYQEFLTQWQGADTSIPIMQQAKAEYATLK
jgi:DNA-binding winged helix-turn-helix (wHTH) protein/tetratricopeptide (TPR) repeat protein